MKQIVKQPVRKLVRGRKPTVEPPDKAFGKATSTPVGRRAYGRPIGNRNTANKKETFLAAMEKCFCNVSKASRASGIPRETHYWWMDTDPDYKKRYNLLIEKRHDFVEDHLMAMIREHNTVIAKHYADCHMKHRGWGNSSKHEIVGAEGGPIQSSIRHEHVVNEIVPDAVVSILKTLVSDNTKVEEAVKRLAAGND